MKSTFSFPLRRMLCLAGLLAGCASPTVGMLTEPKGAEGTRWQTLSPDEGVRAEEHHDDHREHAEGSDPAMEAHPSHAESYPEPFGADLTQGWLDPWPHRHFSRRGTPFVHLFGFEPAFLDRDVFLDYRAARGDGGDEAEMEVEVEWALTRRLGLAVEVPHAWLDPDGGSNVAGFGDFAVATRALLVDSDRFLLSALLDVSVPSGSEAKGLGSGEVGLAPSLSAWLDLGNWFQAAAQVGTAHGLESGDAEFAYGGALAYTFKAAGLPGLGAHGHEHGGHFPAGLTSVIVEVTGRSIFEGSDTGRDTAEALLGLSYALNGSYGIRGGYQFPVGGRRDYDEAFILSVVYHF